MEIGACYRGNSRADFTVWAPGAEDITLVIISSPERLIPLRKQEQGYWSASVEGIQPGARYRYRIDHHNERPDPASFFQPDGVHGPSQIIDHAAFRWTDSHWQGIPLRQMILYEIHVGAFTPEGTFDAIIPRLAELRELGVNAIELMPVAQFPGERNWGYDGVYLFSAQNSYGGPDGLKRLVNAAHEQGVAVLLDVVYNHLGPEGNYLAEFAPYFTTRYPSSWPSVLNFDGPGSDGVRQFVCENARYWLSVFHVDGLRLDSVQQMFDTGSRPIVRELSQSVKGWAQEQGLICHLIAEDDQNDVRLLQPLDKNGCGLDGLWLDDFHHSMHSLLTGEKQGIYQDFGDAAQMIKAFNEGFVYSGNYSVFRVRSHGTASRNISPRQFIAFSQNHDQVGNRPQGERLSRLVSFEALKLAATAVMLSPYVPLLFMGEEYAEENPFYYFISHQNPALVENVRQGRREQSLRLGFAAQPPDPQDEATFQHSKLQWQLRQEGRHKVLREYYRELILLRRKYPALYQQNRQRMQVTGVPHKGLVCWRAWAQRAEFFCVMNFFDREISFAGELPPGTWRRVVDSSDERWLGTGSLFPERIYHGQQLDINAHSAAVFEKEVLR